jgi:hypothetical protein
VLSSTTDTSKTYTSVVAAGPRRLSWLSRVIQWVKIESGLFMVEPWEQVLTTAVFLLVLAGVWKILTMIIMSGAWSMSS